MINLNQIIINALHKGLEVQYFLTSDSSGFGNYLTLTQCFYTHIKVHWVVVITPWGFVVAILLPDLCGIIV
jgi:hypothetical protein